jgi:hypothetical protein
MFYTILDENGFELYGVNLEEAPTENHTEVLRTEFFVKPKFDTIWIEGATEEEILTYNSNNEETL